MGLLKRDIITIHFPGFLNPLLGFFLQLFKEDPETGLTHVALSSDSTCVNNLYSSQDGYETLHMAKEEQPRGRTFFTYLPSFSFN